MKRTKKPANEKPKCASCNERDAHGSLYIRYDPYDEQLLNSKDRHDPGRIDRGFSLHLPICGVCCKRSFKIDLKLDIKSERNTWGHLDPKVTP